jgi:hypothetical protein
MPKILLEDIQGDFVVQRGKIVQESLANGRTATRIPGRFSLCDSVNGNNRRYPRRVWEKQLSDGSHLMNLIKSNEAFGLLEHPKDGVVDLNSPISHLVCAVNLVNEGNNLAVDGEIRVLSTAEGQKLMALIEAGYNPRVSSRGFGSLSKGSDGIDEVQDDYVCEGWDVVFKPSFKEAVLIPSREKTTQESQVEHTSKMLEHNKKMLEGLGGDSIDKIMRYEQGEMDEDEIIEFFQELLDSGLVFQLQGHYGRTAQMLLNNGLISKKESPKDTPPKDTPPEDTEESQKSISAAKPVLAEQEKTSKPMNGATAEKQNKENENMDAKTIRARLESLRSADPIKLGSSQFAEGLRALSDLHNEVAVYLSEDVKRSWEATTLHEEIKGVETAWQSAAEAPKKAAKKLEEDNLKLMKVIKAVGTQGLTYKEKLGEALKNGTKLQGLVEEVTKRGRGWKSLAEKHGEAAAKTQDKYKVACEALDIMAQRYKDDVTAIGKRVIELEFKDKLSEELSKELSEAKLPKHIAQIREKLEGKKLTQPKEGEAPKKSISGDGKGKTDDVAKSPGKVQSESEKTAEKGTETLDESKQPEKKQESVVIERGNQANPMMIEESVSIAKRLSKAVMA